MTGKVTSSSEVVWSTSDLAGDPHVAADKADRVRRMFAAIAHRYDINNRLHSFGRDQAWRRRIVSMSSIQKTDEVLDVACGTGDLAEAYAEAGARSVTGVDFTPEMLRLAERKADTRRRRSAVVRPRYEQGDATALRYDDASFDVVSIAFGLRNIAQPESALGEFHRVLRSGGRVAILEFSEPRNTVLRFLNGVYCRQVMPLTATLIAQDRSGAYRYLPRSISTFADPDELAQRLEHAGFTDVHQRAMTFGVCTATMAIRC